MLKLLSLNQLLSHNFYHKQQQCTYAFKKIIGKSLVFDEVSPEISYQKRGLRLSLEQLFHGQDIEILIEGKKTPIYGYFNEQYNNIKTKLNTVKTNSEIKQLLDEIDPFWLSKLRVDTDNAKSFKRKIFNLLEQDWQEINRLHQNTVSDIEPQDKASTLPNLEDLGKLKYSFIDFQNEINKSPQEYTNLLEKTYHRNEIIITKGLNGDIAPFLVLITEKHIKNYLLAQASDLETYIIKHHCHIEAIKNQHHLPSAIDKVLTNSQAAITKIDLDENSFILVLLAVRCKLDGLSLLITIKLELPRKTSLKSEGLTKRYKTNKGLMKLFRNPQLYAEISCGLSEFLSHRNYKIIPSSDTRKLTKKKLEDLLKSSNILDAYKKLLSTLNKGDIHNLLVILGKEKQEKIKEIFQITILYYLNNIVDSKNIYTDINFLKNIKSYADEARIVFDESDWEEIIGGIESIIKSSSIDYKLLFPLLEHFFEDSLFLTTYRNLSEIETDGVSSQKDYISLCLMIFNHNNWERNDQGYQTLNPISRKAIIEFLLEQAYFRLKRSHNVEQIIKVGNILNKLKIKLKGEDLKLLVNQITDEIIQGKNLSGTIEDVSRCFTMLEFFSQGLPHLKIYKEFSQIYTDRERFSDCDYVTVALMFFDCDNWDKSDPLELNEATKKRVKEFIVNQMICLLPDTQGREKISLNKDILEKLDIALTGEDIELFIKTIESSPLIDYKSKEIRNGQMIQNHFEILSIFLSATNILEFYNQFAKIKMGQYNFSDIHFVTTALKILNHGNWQQDVPDKKTCQRIKELYFSTFLNPQLGRDDKIYNFDILHNHLKILISEHEKNELSKNVKNRIEGLVDLIDTMEELVVEATTNK